MKLSAYQKKRKAAMVAKNVKIAALTKALLAKGNIFFMEKQTLGISRLRLGTVIDGKLEYLHEEPA